NGDYVSPFAGAGNPSGFEPRHDPPEPPPASQIRRADVRSLRGCPAFLDRPTRTPATTCLPGLTAVFARASGSTGADPRLTFAGRSPSADPRGPAAGSSC